MIEKHRAKQYNQREVMKNHKITMIAKCEARRLYTQMLSHEMLQHVSQPMGVILLNDTKLFTIDHWTGSPRVMQRTHWSMHSYGRPTANSRGGHAKVFTMVLWSFWWHFHCSWHETDVMSATTLAKPFKLGRPSGTYAAICLFAAV